VGNMRQNETTTYQFSFLLRSYKYGQGAQRCLDLHPLFALMNLTVGEISPAALRQINRPFIRASAHDGRDDDVVTDGELVSDAKRFAILGIQPPERTADGFQRLNRALAVMNERLDEFISFL